METNTKTTWNNDFFKGLGENPDDWSNKIDSYFSMFFSKKEGLKEKKETLDEIEKKEKEKEKEKEKKKKEKEQMKEKKEMENYKHIELLKNIFDLKENIESVMEGGMFSDSSDDELDSEDDDIRIEEEKKTKKVKTKKKQKKGEGLKNKKEEDEEEKDDTKKDEKETSNKEGATDFTDSNNYKNDDDSNLDDNKKNFNSSANTILEMNPLGYIISKMDEILDILENKRDAMNNFYIKTAKHIADNLSDGTATPSDQKFIYEYFGYFIVTIMSLMVFLNFYFLIYFGNDVDVNGRLIYENLSGWNKSDYYKTATEYYYNFFQNIPLLSVFFYQFVEIGVDSFIYIISTFHWLFPYLFIEYWAIGSHVVLPNMYFLINYLVDQVHQALYPFILSMFPTRFSFKELTSNKIFLFATIITFYHYCKGWMDDEKLKLLRMFRNQIPLPSGFITFIIFIFMVIIFIMLNLITIVLCAYFSIYAIVIYFLYYSFVPLCFYGEGLLKNLRNVFDSLNHFNYQYIARTDDPKCIPGVHPCKEHGFIGWIFEFLVEPSHVFVVRHFFSFVLALFFLVFMVVSFYTVQSAYFKKVLILISLGLSIAIMMMGNWFSRMTLLFPIHKDKRVDQELGFLPLLSGLGFLIICVLSYVFYIIPTALLSQLTLLIIALTVLIWYFFKY